MADRDTTSAGGVLSAARAVRNGQSSAAMLADEAVRKAGEHEHLNALLHVADAYPLAAGDSAGSGRALAGVPLIVKDNIHVAGMPNTAGTPALQEFRPREHAPAVRRLLDAGATIIGKAGMHELAFGITCANSHFGTIRNAHDPSRFPGGSSGGTAAAVAAGIVPAGLGTDTGGSVRIPAALNGICGFRPTTGRYPSAGVTPLSSSRDTIGPLARTVADLAALDSVLAADPNASVPQPFTQPLRLGVPRTFFTEDLAEDVAELWQLTLDRLARAGVTLVDVEVGHIADLDRRHGMPLVLAESGPMLREYLARYVPGLTLEALVEMIASPDVRAVFADAILPGAPHLVRPPEYDLARRGRAQLQGAFEEVFGRHTLAALVYPTTPAVAQDLACTETCWLNGREVPTFLTFIRNTAPGSFAGLPGLTISMGSTSSGLPAGLAVDAPAGSDRALLSVGLAVERILAH